MVYLKKSLVLAILMALGFFVGSGGCAAPSAAIGPPVPPPESRLEIVSEALDWPGGWAYVVRDKKTEQEFIFIDGPDSVAVCPIRSGEK